MNLLYDDPNEYLPTERIAIVVAALYEGGTVTTSYTADLLGITRQGAWAMLSKVSRVLPVTEENGRWWLINQRLTELE